MSKISISVSEPMTDLRAIKFLHNLLGMSLSTAKKSLLNGKNGVFFCAELYLNDHREVAGNILKIVDFFDAIDTDLFIVEVDSDTDWEGAILEENRISKDILKNILDEADGMFL